MTLDGLVGDVVSMPPASGGTGRIHDVVQFTNTPHPPCKTGPRLVQDWAQPRWRRETAREWRTRWCDLLAPWGTFSLWQSEGRAGPSVQLQWSRWWGLIGSCATKLIKLHPLPIFLDFFIDNRGVRQLKLDDLDGFDPKLHGCRHSA
jgi:hypothetical protein